MRLVHSVSFLALLALGACSSSTSTSSMDASAPDAAVLDSHVADTSTDADVDAALDANILVDANVDGGSDANVRDAGAGDWDPYPLVAEVPGLGSEPGVNWQVVRAVRDAEGSIHVVASVLARVGSTEGEKRLLYGVVHEGATVDVATFDVLANEPGTGPSYQCDLALGSDGDAYVFYGLSDGSALALLHHESSAWTPIALPALAASSIGSVHLTASNGRLAISLRADTSSRLLVWSSTPPAEWVSLPMLATRALFTSSAESDLRVGVAATSSDDTEYYVVDGATGSMSTTEVAANPATLLGGPGRGTRPLELVIGDDGIARVAYVTSYDCGDYLCQALFLAVQDGEVFSSTMLRAMHYASQSTAITLVVDRGATRIATLADASQLYVAQIDGTSISTIDLPTSDTAFSNGPDEALLFDEPFARLTMLRGYRSLSAWSGPIE